MTLPELDNDKTPSSTPVSIRRIQVGFSHTNGFWSLLSRIIMLATGKPYSHCWLFIPNGILGKDVVLQASKENYAFVEFSSFSASNTIVKIVTPPYPLESGVQAGLEWLGEPYDYTGLAGMLWVLIGRRFHKKWKNWLAAKGHMWCSESVAAVLKNLPDSYPLAKDIDVTRMGPEDVDALLSGQAVD